MKKNKDWLKRFLDLFRYLMYLFLGSMFIMGFVASMHYMAIVAHKYEYVKQMFLWWGCFGISWFVYVVLAVIKKHRDQKKNEFGFEVEE